MGALLEIGLLLLIVLVVVGAIFWPAKGARKK